MPADVTIDAFSLWMGLSGLVWVGLAAYRFKGHGLDAANVLLVGAALAGWIGLLRLATSFFGEEIVPLDVLALLEVGPPLYTVLVALALACASTAMLARRSPGELGAALVLLVGVPVVGLPAMYRDRLPVATAGPLAATLITDRDHPGMVYVPEGPFIMGTLSTSQLESILGNEDGDEQPVRGVYLDAFYIDRTEVTNRDFAQFVEGTGHVTDAELRGFGAVWGDDGVWFDQPGAQWRHPIGPDESTIEGLDDHPVVQVSWNDASAFCAWSGKRLPREAEWEKAARGVDGRAYPWGPEFDPSRLNYCDASCTLPFRDPSASDGFVRTAPVGSFPTGESPYGALDMAGNAWEWVQDWYDPDYYRYAPDVNPPGPQRGRRGAADGSKVVRGASFAATLDFQTTTSRSFDPFEDSYFGVGLRCADDG